MTLWTPFGLLAEDDTYITLDIGPAIKIDPADTQRRDTVMRDSILRKDIKF
jgi:hypothetical protein